MTPTPDPAFLTGLRNGILLALPLWGLIYVMHKETP